MRSLFAKIVVWFLAAAVLIVICVLVTTSFTVSSMENRRPTFAMLLDLQLNEAKKAYETGGPAALQAELKLFGRGVEGRCVLLDGEGKNLVTGQPEPEFFKEAQRHPAGLPRVRQRASFWAQFLPPRTPPVISIHTPDFHYYYCVQPPRRWFPFWFLTPVHLWVIPLAVLLCYGLARHLSSPVKELQQAAARLGQGELSVRSKLKRRDELGRLSASFNEMADRIETLLTAERRLLQDISHELRSPLARLNVAVELARGGDDLDVALARIEKEAGRLNQLVDELLQVTRAEGDPTRLFQQEVRLDQLVQELVEDSLIEAKAHGCSLQMEPGEPVRLKGHAELLRRAVENVVRNAIHYAPASTSVVVEVEKRDQTASVTVRDFGSGVPEAELARIFDPFYRVETDRNRRQGGVGLGLAIVKRSVELHKGRIIARNANPGLIVRLDLPIASTT